MNEHPFGWFSLLPPLTAIFLAIVTRRVVVSLLLGIYVGALVIKDWNPAEALGHMFSDHLWNKMIDSEMLHVFFFTLLMGMMVGMINRAAGMRGLVNVMSPWASNRKRGQLTTWFLGLFVFFDDYANTVLLGNTLKPLTDRLRIAREKLAYLVDSTAAPVAGLALVSTWVAGEIGYVSDGLKQLPAPESWNAFDVFIRSIPYRFYVLFALLFVPMVAVLGRDFGPMLKAERKAIREGLLPAVESGPANADSADAQADSTRPDDKTPARWFNAVIPVLVTVGAVVYFLYTTGKESAKDNSLREIFGNADSYSSLLWGAAWGVGTAYLLIAIQRLITFRQLHSAAAGGARLMVPALIVLWLAQSMSNMTRNQELKNPDEKVAVALVKNQISSDQGIRYLVQNTEVNEQEAAVLADSLSRVIRLKHDEYVEFCKARLSEQVEKNEVTDRKRLRVLLKEIESTAWEKLKQEIQPVSELLQSHDSLTEFVLKTVDVKKLDEHREQLEFGGKFVKTASTDLPRWTGDVNDETTFSGELEEGNQDLLVHEEKSLSVHQLNYSFVFRTGKLYTGDFLSEKLSSMRKGNGWIANNFVQLLPTIVFVLASFVAFATGTSWGTMGIVMPLVIPLAYGQLAAGGEDVTAGNAVLLCCIGSVLAGAIFGDHCSPISDTTVLSSQASGCDHVAHVRTQLPYALAVGLISIVCGTLPIGYGVSVWVLLPLGIVGMLGVLMLFGSRVESPDERSE